MLSCPAFEKIEYTERGIIHFESLSNLFLYEYLGEGVPRIEPFELGGEVFYNCIPHQLTNNLELSAMIIPNPDDYQPGMSINEIPNDGVPLEVFMDRSLV